MKKPLAKKTDRQLEAINQLKKMESNLKTLRTLLPQPEDYATKAEYKRAVNTANKNFWKMPKLGKDKEGIGLGEYTIRLEKQIAELKDLMGKPRLGTGVQIPAYLKGLTKDEKIATNTLHIGFGNAQQRRRNPLLRINKGGGGAQWDNPFYNRRYDKAVIQEEKIVAEAAQRDYKRSTDNWHLDPDGWMKDLPIWHSLNPLSPNRIAPSGEENDAPASLSQAARIEKHNAKLGIESVASGGWVGRGKDVRMPDGGSSVLSIHSGADYGNLKHGDQVGVRTRSWRRKYDNEMRKRLTVSES